MSARYAREIYRFPANCRKVGPDVFGGKFPIDFDTMSSFILNCKEERQWTIT